jgi:hypothetical protein
VTGATSSACSGVASGSGDSGISGSVEAVGAG